MTIITANDRSQSMERVEETAQFAKLNYKVSVAAAMKTNNICSRRHPSCFHSFPLSPALFPHSLLPILTSTWPWTHCTLLRGLKQLRNPQKQNKFTRQMSNNFPARGDATCLRLCARSAAERAKVCSRCSMHRNTNSVEPSFSWVRRKSSLNGGCSSVAHNQRMARGTVGTRFPRPAEQMQTGGNIRTLLKRKK